MQLFRTKTFRKEYAKYLQYVVALLDLRQLPRESRDHSLSGHYNGFREFHIGGDMLIIYLIEDDILRLTRIGTHSQLF